MTAIEFRVSISNQLGISACSTDMWLGGARGSTEAINSSTIVEDCTVITLVMSIRRGSVGNLRWLPSTGASEVGVIGNDVTTTAKRLAVLLSVYRV